MEAPVSLDRVVRGMGGLLVCGLAGMGIGAVTGAAVGALFFGVGAIYGVAFGFVAGFPAGILGGLLWTYWGWVVSGVVGAATGGSAIAAGFGLFRSGTDPGTAAPFVALFIVLPAAAGYVAGHKVGKNLDEHRGGFFQTWRDIMDDRLAYYELSAVERFLSLIVLAGTGYGLYLLFKILYP